MKRLSRDEFAGRALPGIIAMPDNHDLSGVEDAAYKVADRMLALSAPDAIEALEGLVEAIEGNPDIHRYAAMKTAKAVLARHKEINDDGDK